MEESRVQQPDHASPRAYPLDARPEDEIDLLDLWRVLVRQWKLIGVITGLSVLGAVVYLLLAVPVYEAQAVVIPPEGKYVQAFNILGISEISSADIFAKFIRNLKARSLRQQFVAENPQFSSLRDKVPEIKEGTKGEAGFFFVSMRGHDAKLLANWVNGFILAVEKKTIDDFLDEFEAKIVNQKKEIAAQLQLGRDFASQCRLDRIALLEEQIAIARASKIFDRQLSGYSVAEGQSFGVTLDTLQGPMYMRGVNELTAEKEALEKRKNDEPFIAGFRDKQERLAQLAVALSQLQAVRVNAHAVTVDQSAVEAKRPVKPRRMLVLALGVMLGGMLGIFAAFVVNFVGQQKKG